MFQIISLNMTLLLKLPISNFNVSLIIKDLCYFDTMHNQLITLLRSVQLCGQSQRLNGRVSAMSVRGRRFDPQQRHTKDVKNGTGSSLAWHYL